LGGDTVLERLRDAVEALPAGLRDHILRVEQEAVRLASVYRVDERRARIAALGHDLVRHKPGQQLLDLAAVYGLAPDVVETASPILVHGPVAARMLVRDYDFDHPEVLAAIDCHTTARAGMSPLEKVLLVADKVEPGKLKRYPEYEEVRDRAQASLDAAVLRYLDLYFGQAVIRGWPVHPRVLEARNELLLSRKRSG
jgi:predicted HD superfamily hydrolase involved in NAD metabolism